MGCKQSRRIQEHLDDNFPTEVIRKPTKEGTLLNLILRNKKKPVRDVKVRSSLDCSDHKMPGFRILKGGNKAKSRVTTLVQRCAWKNTIGYSSGEKRDPGEFVDSEGSSTRSRMVLPNKQNIKQRRPAWKKDLLTKVKHK